MTTLISKEEAIEKLRGAVKRNPNLSTGLELALGFIHTLPEKQEENKYEIAKSIYKEWADIYWGLPIGELNFPKWLEQKVSNNK